MNSSVGEYKTVEDVISDLNVMIVEARIPNEIKRKLADLVGELETIVVDRPRWKKGECYDRLGD